jgi:hypothetical protein
MRLIFLTAILLSLAPNAARAQMVLPGAVGAPTPAGQSGAPPAVARRPPASSNPANSNPDGDVAYDRHFTAAKPPSVDSVVGKPFVLLGARGALLVEKSGGDLVLSRLTVPGDKISLPNQSCELAIGGGSPLRLKPLGAPEGVQRFEVDSSACPLQFDVLNGALRAFSPAGSCEFRQADCRVDASGLWGPAGDSFSDSQKKTFERERAALEKDARGHFRALLHRFRKDKPAAQAVVREQAGFSASRSQSCRDYDREDTHGFCSLRLTEARDYKLQTRLAEEALKKDKLKEQKSAKRGAVARPSLAPKSTLPSKSPVPAAAAVPAN